MKKEAYHQPLLTRHSLPRAVAAKAISECALLLVFSGGMTSGVELKISKEGTNMVVSWPTSTTNLVLETSSSLTTGWTAVASAPVTNQQVVSVTLPMAGSRKFFRLKDATYEKDPLADKDPNEKDPISDKDPNEKDKENTGS
jgi:hypothetical protein